MLTLIVSIFCLFFLLYQITLVASSTPPRYVLIDDITLDCGSATSGKSMDLNGRDWTGDFLSKYFPKKELNNLNSQICKAPVERIVTGAPYSTLRISYYQCLFLDPLKHH